MTEDDRARLQAILLETDDRQRVQLIIAYWHDDMDRADRTPRAVLYFHIGMLCGLCDDLLRREQMRNVVEDVGRRN